MKAFMVGSNGPFLITLVERFSKEGWDCFTLTGKKRAEKRPVHKVVGEYSYEYDNEIVKNIIQSVSPDVVIFTGAYDGNMNKKNVRDYTVKYIAGLTNVLMACRLNQVRHVIYISSEKVIEGDFPDRILEEEEKNASDFIGMTILEGERLCKLYQKKGEMEVTIARIIHMYGYPRHGEREGGFYSDLCYRLIKGDVITYQPEHLFSCIYIPDAVDAIYKLVSATKRRYFVYQIASMDIIKEQDMIENIKAWEQGGIQFEPLVELGEKRQIFSSERIRNEFGFLEKYHFEKVSRGIYRYYKKHVKDLLTGKEYEEAKGKKQRKNYFSKIIQALIPYLENVVVFLLVLFISKETATFSMLSVIDFFYLYVLLFALVYGRKHSLVACLLSVLGKVWLLSGESSVFSVLVDLRVYLWTLMVFLIGTSVGYLKDMYKRYLIERDEQIHYLNLEVEDLNSINESNLSIKKLYEARLLNYQDSLGKIYHITSQLDQMEPGKVLINAALVIEQVMGTEEIAIYNVVNDSYCRLAIATSQKARAFGKSRKYKELGELYESIARNEVYINRTLEENYPMMAHAIFNQNQMEMIIMIWGLSFEQLTLYQSNLLMILGKMMYESIHRAYKYMESMSSQKFIEGTEIMEQDAFCEIIENEQYANELGMSEYTVLVVQIKERSLKEWNQTLTGMIRDSDYLGLLNDRELGILLTNTASADYFIVSDRLKKLGIECRMGRGGKGL